MEEELANGELGMIGLGRPLCTDLDTPKELIEGRIDQAVSREYRLRLADRVFR